MSSPNETKNPRRNFIKDTLIAGAGLLVAASSITVSHGNPDAPQAVPKLPNNLPEDTNVLRMQRDLIRALEKPVHERSWTMVIDLKKCVGCFACTVACKAENGLPPGVLYRPVIEEEYGKYPFVKREFLPRPCMHCENPACVKVCPVEATYKREDGIVSINYEKCIGCRYCMTACPYGARTFDWGEFYTEGTPRLEEYEKLPSFEYGKGRKRAAGKSPVGNTRKCHYCLHRLNKGMLPACVTTCMGRATYFGDKNDNKSLVYELLGKSKPMRLKEELGTRPTTVYLT